MEIKFYWLSLISLVAWFQEDIANVHCIVGII